MLNFGWGLSMWSPSTSMSQSSLTLALDQWQILFHETMAASPFTTVLRSATQTWRTTSCQAKNRGNPNRHRLGHLKK